MAWIESHQSLGTHRKTWTMARALKCSPQLVVGYLHYIWWWALDNTPDGSLAGVDSVDIARAAGFRGPPSKLWNALTQAGFITGTPPELHDWNVYAGKLITMRKSNAVKQQRYRERNRDVMVTLPVTLPLRNGATVPNPTIPNSTNNPLTPLKGGIVDKIPYQEIINLFNEICGGVGMKRIKSFHDTLHTT